VITREGQELVSMDADGVWTESKICSRIPGLVGPPLRAARLLYGDDLFSSGTSLSMPSLKSGAGIQLVLDRRGGDNFACFLKGGEL